MESPLTGPSPEDSDFLALLDKKLRKRNERLIEKLLTWGELLNAAGWSVAVSGAADEVWLSERARLDLQGCDGLPTTWPDLLARLGGISAKSVHQKGEGVIVWSTQERSMKPSGPGADLTQRETEVMSWLREGKTSSEIAIISGCATRTVEKHLGNLYRKLGVRNRAAVILKSTTSSN